MGKLNAPRTIPYDFRVFELDGWVWLYDESERTYICSAQPMIFAEPLYALDEDDEEDAVDADYWHEKAVIGAKKNVSLKMDAEYVAPDVPYKEAWESAMEEAQANHRI